MLGRINILLGHTLCWLILAMVVLSFINVIQRYLFQSNAIWQAELVLFMHSLVFLGAAGFTLKENKHVRVDVLYERFSPKTQTRINKIGTILFLFPVCAALMFFSADYVSESWRIFEASREAGGMAGVFLWKSFIYLFSITLIVQGVKYLFGRNKS